jgi:uncharacterized protein
MSQSVKPFKWHDRLGYRIKTAIVTIPRSKDWRYALILLGLFGVIYLPIGFATGFLTIAPRLNPGLVVTIMGSALLMPGISEEFVFRVLLMPHRTEPMRPLMRRFWMVLSWVLFLLYHLPTWTPAFFKMPVFLIGAGLVGIVCTLSYRQSRSIWTAVFIHWTIVVVWLLLLGGLARFES